MRLYHGIWQTELENPVNINGYSGEASFEALGIALTIYCVQTLREEGDVKSEMLLQGLHEYARIHGETTQIENLISSCQALKS